MTGNPFDGLPGREEVLPGPQATGGIRPLTATGLYARIRSELGGRGPDSEDLAVLCGELLAAFTPDAAWLWLQGYEPHLGARPLDVLAVAGTDPVRDAIRTYLQGAFE
ncbi:hypothetical protein ACFQ36_01615 [Arthrobacter sp. GCM10027362]|uniref:hypothetical protein n=1 Tax=Arthrobacter sp. GCM10027362 TaxID=3273379 RepID=UPI003645D331